MYIRSNSKLTVPYKVNNTYFTNDLSAVYFDSRVLPEKKERKNVSIGTNKKIYVY